MLYLPEPGLVIPPVPVMPMEGEVKSAVRLIDSMLADFPFESEHDRANYRGCC